MNESCIDPTDTSCINSLLLNNTINYINKDPIFTEINNLFINYGNYSILPWNGTIINDYFDSKLNNFDKCEISALNSEQNYDSNIIATNWICCLAYGSCYESNLTTMSDLICNGLYSCESLIFSNCFNLFVGGYGGITYSNINFANMAIMEAGNSCEYCTLVDGFIVGALGAYSVINATIINVNYVIALGYRSLYNSKIINANIIYLMGYDAANGLSINNCDNCTIYCSVTACNNVNPSTVLYCSDYNDYGVATCKLASAQPSVAPTFQPTIVPTEKPDLKVSTINSSLNKFGMFLENGVIIFAVILVCIVIILIFISIQKK